MQGHMVDRQVVPQPALVIVQTGIIEKCVATGVVFHQHDISLSRQMIVFCHSTLLGK